MKELLKYHTRIYLKSNKLVMPLLLWLVFLRIGYSQKPLEYLPNIVMSAGVLLFITTWLGFSYMDLEDPITEQIMILKLSSIHWYNISKIIFLIGISLMMSLISVAVPVIQNILLRGSLFKREIIYSDVLGAVLLHFLIAVLGAMVGALAHPRIIKNRKLAVLAAGSVALIGYTIGIIKSNFPVAKLVIWVFPPVYDILEKFNGLEYFSLSNMLIPVIYGCVYIILYILLQMFLLYKVKY